MNSQKALLKVNEAAAALSIGRATLYKLIAARKISVVKLGRSTRITPEEIERFVSTLPTGEECWRHEA